VSLQLGQPVIGALQLLFAPDRVPAGDDLARLATFGIRAAQALRAGAGAIGVERELERTRALLDVLGVATARLSLRHTLETTLEKTASLVGTDRLEIYLRVDGRLVAGTDERLHGPHLAVAERLLELLDGPYRARTVLAFDDVGAEPQLASVAAAAREADIDAAVAVPLRVHDEDLGLVPVGLVGIFPPRGRALASGEVALLSALAGQVAVAVQNARLHEQAKEQEERLTAALGRERRAAAQLRAFYTISQAFSEGEASVDGMLEAVVDTVVGELDVDAALISMPDERREVLVPRRLRVADDRLAEAAETILFRPQPLTARPIRRLLGERRPLRLDPATVRGLGGELALLAPFLEKGWTGAIVPIHTPTELLAVLPLLSLRPGRPIAASTLEGAQRIAAHAAVALDRARLYEQQKEFADTMQRSLLPRERPEPPGLEVGAAYTVSAKVDVGGDVFDFLELGDGRLAVVLGDVTGHGIEATADMAMAKFVFRSLAREHPEPGDFLAAANTVVTGEIAPGKFITMHYLVLDGRTGVLACAGAGHPPPRLLDADGSVRPLEARGLVLGVADGQVYEEVHDRVAPGGAVVLYTDGVVEARRGGELFGTERLDELLASRRGLAPQELAEAVLDECRAYAGGELGDDCAVVVVRRA
jgi:serine phosphatase RsbU (regulator of sigma subunit)